MNFNVDRIAVLAGLAQSGKSGLIKEAAAPVTPAPAAKPAAPAAPVAKAPAPAPAKAAPAKKMEEEAYDESMYEMGHDMGEMDDDMEEMYHDTMGGMSYDEDMVYEVDETQLMEALVDMREKRIQESRVRAAIREELNDILSNKEAGSRWLYGNRQPSNSGKGSVARGFLGPGFR